MQNGEKRERNGRIKMKGKTKKGRRTVRNDRRGIRTAPKSWTIFNCHTSVTRSKPRLIVFSFYFFFHAVHAGNRSFSYFSRVHGGTGKNSTTKHRWKSEAIDEWIPCTLLVFTRFYSFQRTVCQSPAVLSRFHEIHGGFRICRKIIRSMIDVSSNNFGISLNLVQT